MVLFFSKLQKTSPTLISCGLPQKQGKEKKILSFPSLGEEMGAPERVGKWPAVSEQDKEMILVGKSLCLQTPSPPPWA